MQAVQPLAPSARPPVSASLDAVVEVRGVHKVYPTGTEALRDINLDFPRGALTSLLGPSSDVRAPRGKSRWMSRSASVPVS